MDDQVGRACDDSSSLGVVSQPGVPDNRFDRDLVGVSKKIPRIGFFFEYTNTMLAQWTSGLMATTLPQGNPSRLSSYKSAAAEEISHA